jgi:hypothetical protein
MNARDIKMYQGAAVTAFAAAVWEQRAACLLGFFKTATRPERPGGRRRHPSPQGTHAAPAIVAASGGTQTARATPRLPSRQTLDIDIPSHRHRYAPASDCRTRSARHAPTSLCHGPRCHTRRFRVAGFDARVQTSGVDPAQDENASLAWSYKWLWTWMNPTKGGKRKYRFCRRLQNRSRRWDDSVAFFKKRSWVPLERLPDLERFCKRPDRAALRFEGFYKRASSHYRINSRAMTIRWISLVPSPISVSFASRSIRSTG